MLSCELELPHALLFFSSCALWAHFVISAYHITRVLHLMCLQSTTKQLSDESDEENFFYEENKEPKNLQSLLVNTSRMQRRDNSHGLENPLFVLKLFIWL